MGTNGMRGSPESCRLDSGLEVMVSTITHSLVANVTLWLRHGAGDDDPEKQGMSHLYEHLMCLGMVEEWGTPGGFAEAVGGRLEAACYDDYIRLQLRVGLDSFGDALKLTSDLWRRGPDTPSLEREKSVLRAEWHEDREIPELRVDSAWRHALGVDRFNGGFDPAFLKGIEAISESDLKALHRSIGPDRMVLQVVSPLPPDQVLDQVNRHFQAPDGPSGERRIPEIPDRGVVAVEETDSDQGQLAFGFVLPSPGLAEHVAGRVILALLCVGTESRLFRALRTERALTYGFDRDETQCRHFDLFSLSTSFDAQAAPEVSQVVLSHIQQLAEGSFSDAELERARKVLIGEHRLYCEDPYQFGKWLGRHYLATDQMVDLPAFDAAVRQVDRTAVMQTLSGALRGGWAAALEGALACEAARPWETLKTAAQVSSRARS